LQKRFVPFRFAITSYEISAFSLEDNLTRSSYIHRHSVSRR